MVFSKYFIKMMQYERIFFLNHHNSKDLIPSDLKKNSTTHTTIRLCKRES